MEYLLEIVEQARGIKRTGWNIFLKWLSKQNGLSKQGRFNASRVEKTFKLVKQAACLVDDTV